MDAEYREGSVPMAVQLLCAEVARSEGAGAENRPNVVAACLSAIFALMSRDVAIADRIDVSCPGCLALQAYLGAGAPDRCDIAPLQKPCYHSTETDSPG